MDCMNNYDVEQLLQEVYVRLQEINVRLEAINSYLNPPVKKPKRKYVGHKTKYGILVESAQRDWLTRFFNKATRTLYKETMHHAKCCLCGKDDISLTANTYRSGGKDYIVPLCDDCTFDFESKPKIVKGSNKVAKKSNLPRARIYYNAVETKRRKF